MGIRTLKLFPGHARIADLRLLLLVPALTLAGCGSGGMDDLHAYVEDVKSRQEGHIEPLPEIKTFETFVYNPVSLRDPFQPADKTQETRITANDNGIRPNSQRRHEELESFPLDSLRMVGTLDKSENTWGIVVASDGTIHRVQNGNFAGQNHGRITRITEERIELTEIVPDGLGGWRERQASLALTE